MLVCFTFNFDFRSSIETKSRCQSIHLNSWWDLVFIACKISIFTSDGINEIFNARNTGFSLNYEINYSNHIFDLCNRNINHLKLVALQLKKLTYMHNIYSTLWYGFTVYRYGIQHRCNSFTMILSYLSRNNPKSL